MSANSSSLAADSPQFLLLTMRERLASQSATCKLVGLVLSIAALAFVSGRTATTGYLLLPLAPLLLSLLLDAAYSARAGQVSKLIQDIAAGDSKAASRPWETIAALTARQGLDSALPAVGGALLLSVWPFYLALGSLVLVLGADVLMPRPFPVLSRNPLPPGVSQTGAPLASYPAHINPPGQPQGVKPPSLRQGFPSANGANASLPVTSKSSPSFSARPSQPQNKAQTAVPVTALSKPPASSAPSVPAPATAPVAAPKTTVPTPSAAAPAPQATVPAPAAPPAAPAQPAAAPVATPPAAKPAPTTSDSAGKKP